MRLVIEMDMIRKATRGQQDRWAARVIHMSRPAVNSIVAFVPARDFEKSRKLTDPAGVLWHITEVPGK